MIMLVRKGKRLFDLSFKSGTYCHLDLIAEPENHNAGSITVRPILEK